MYAFTTLLAQVSVSPNSSGMPGGPFVQQLLGWISQLALWGSLASILIGAGLYGISQNSGNYAGGYRGKQLAAAGENAAREYPNISGTSSLCNVQHTFRRVMNVPESQNVNDDPASPASAIFPHTSIRNTPIPPDPVDDDSRSHPGGVCARSSPSVRK